MSVFSGTQILNIGMPGESLPVVPPVLVVPAGQQFNVVGLAFSNSLNAIVAVSVFRDSLNGPPAFTINVPALAGQGVVPVAQQAYAQVLGPGETLYAVPAFAGWGYITTEIDGYISAV
jgi:hypothetical protein